MRASGVSHTSRGSISDLEWLGALSIFVVESLLDSAFFETLSAGCLPTH